MIAGLSKFVQVHADSAIELRGGDRLLLAREPRAPHRAIRTGGAVLVHDAFYCAGRMAPLSLDLALSCPPHTRYTRRSESGACGRGYRFFFGNRGCIVDFTRITLNPNQMGGVPCIRGLRIPVATVVGMVADGMSTEEIVEAYPDLEEADIREALKFAAEAVRERELPLVPSA